MKKVLLAFSGGLDTTYCAIYLREALGLEVHTALVDTGGFTREALTATAQRAEALGVASHRTLDEVQRFYEGAVRYLVFGNVLRNQTYPLSVSAERIFQAMALARYAREIGADAVAHGSTGAGNDQVRFDLAFRVLAPNLEIITPIRDQQLSRQQEIDYLRDHGVAGDWAKAKYSVNQGLWGTSVGGAETLTSHAPLPDEAYPHPLRHTEPRTVTLDFERGELTGIDDVRLTPVNAIRELDALANDYAIGRDVHVGDTIVGIKGRVGFAAAAALLTIRAHHALEKHVLTKWQQHWKEQLGNWYGMLMHEGQYLEPVMRNIETFLTDTQRHVTGTVRVLLAPYRFQIEGVRAPRDLMNAKFGAYGEMNRAWTGEDVKGFTEILANPLRIYYAVNGMEEDDRK